MRGRNGAKIAVVDRERNEYGGTVLFSVDKTLMHSLHLKIIDS